MLCVVALQLRGWPVSYPWYLLLYPCVSLSQLLSGLYPSSSPVRLVLLVTLFICLKSVPAEAFVSWSWTYYIPHFSLFDLDVYRKVFSFVVSNSTNLKPTSTAHGSPCKVFAWRRPGHSQKMKDTSNSSLDPLPFPYAHPENLIIWITLVSTPSPAFKLGELLEAKSFSSTVFQARNNPPAWRKSRLRPWHSSVSPGTSRGPPISIAYIWLTWLNFYLKLEKPDHSEGWLAFPEWIPTGPNPHAFLENRQWIAYFDGPTVHGWLRSVPFIISYWGFVKALSRLCHVRNDWLQWDIAFFNYDTMLVSLFATLKILSCSLQSLLCFNLCICILVPPYYCVHTSAVQCNESQVILSSWYSPEQFRCRRGMAWRW